MEGRIRAMIAVKKDMATGLARYLETDTEAPAH